MREVKANKLKQSKRNA